MPKCKNDSKNTYKGTEPSPKGFGWCAHAEQVGTLRKGKDGQQWIVEEASNRTLRWVPITSSEELLYDKMYPWWSELAEGGLLVIYHNGRHKIVTIRTKSMDKYTKQHLALAADSKVKAIVWTARSTDCLTFFVHHILKKRSKQERATLLKSKNPLKLIVKDCKKYFEKYRLETDKDYTLKSCEPD